MLENVSFQNKKRKKHSVDMDPIMRLKLFADNLERQGVSVSSFFMGKPTLAMSATVARRMALFWLLTAKKICGSVECDFGKNNKSIIQDSLKGLTEAVCLVKKHLFSSGDTVQNLAAEEAIEKIAAPVIDYQDPQGVPVFRKGLSAELSIWYDMPIIAEDVIFTVGGANAIHCLLGVNRGNKILVQYPYYTLYAQEKSLVNLPEISTEALEQSLLDNPDVAVLLIVDPSNPLGTVLSNEQMDAVIHFLNNHPDIKVWLDEAYAEQRFGEEDPKGSLLSYAYNKMPGVVSQIVTLRSATKAASAAGERMACIICKDATYMKEILARVVSSVGHASVSGQVGLIACFNALNKSFDHIHKYYIAKKQLVKEGLRKIGVPCNEAAATFYVCCNFSQLKGECFSEECQDFYRIQGRRIKTRIETDEDIAIYLACKYGILLAPLSYYGGNEEDGLLRITCSGTQKELKYLLKQIKRALCDGRSRLMARNRGKKHSRLLFMTRFNQKKKFFVKAFKKQ